MSVTARSASPPLCLPLPSRNFLGNHFVYFVLSQRAGGLSIGINMNPDKRCNFDCAYCEVDRSHRGASSRVNISILTTELQNALQMARDGRLGELGYSQTNSGLLLFKEVALSGDGEPTLCPNFRQIIESVVCLRSRHHLPFFKIVLITNASGLHLPGVEVGVDLLTPGDEVWAKLDAGTQACMEVVNSPEVSLETVLANILELGRRRPVIIQSLFPLIHGGEPPDDEIAAYAQRLLELKDAGAQIPLVQIYSAHRPAMNVECAHLPLRSLSRIARTVREVSGLNAEVF